MTPNTFLLAADNSPALLSLLRENPTLAAAQDEHGYSLVHAAASYNHLDLLRALVLEFHVDVDVKDEDNETALFVVETLEAAKVLVEELGVDTRHKGADGLTAREKIELEGEFPTIAAYLASIDINQPRKQVEATAKDFVAEANRPPPRGMKLVVSTMDAEEQVPSDIDPGFRRRMEELAQRDDFSAPSGQADLRKLVEDAISDRYLAIDRNVRPRQTQ
ncbi:ankyrin repeat-containing protein [Metarhizium album ARSEF 1941]|uniref:Ankyrin repeat-containing protein n=1 Tax=Metarhizium album (strain ARSEF 1941) TaxID=1081103 RepID=A0A0B2WYV0_METAS|nr:ankyrin repeat-containing protein [Metarhizium album ARSEF 1941]KHN98607.1 ankyrin repeat-containing protein [Metarhizium album ARSEF 1941]